MFGHIGASMLGHIFESQPDRLWAEIQTFASLLLPSDYHQGQLEGHSSTLMKRVQNGDGSYRYRTATIIDRLDIQDTEMVHLKALISKDEKDRRRNVRRRDKGRSDRTATTGQDRDEWRVQVAAGSAELEKPWEHHGMSRATWYRHKASGSVKKLPKSRRVVSDRARVLVMGQAQDKAAFRAFMSYRREYWRMKRTEAVTAGWSADALDNQALAMRADFARLTEYYRAGAEGRAVKRREPRARRLSLVAAQAPQMTPTERQAWREQMEDMDAFMSLWAA